MVTRIPIILQMENWSLLYIQGCPSSQSWDDEESRVEHWDYPHTPSDVPSVSLKKCLWMIDWSWGSHLGFQVCFHRGTWSYCVGRRIHGLWKANKEWIPGPGDFCWKYSPSGHTQGLPPVSLLWAESHTRMTWRWPSFSCVIFPNQLTSLNLHLFTYGLLTTAVLYFGLTLNILWG